MIPFPIIDSHVHLWDPQRFRITWLDGNAVLDQPYGVDDLRTHSAGLDLAGFVYVEVAVEPAYSLLEAQRVAEIARAEPLLLGAVAAAPLEFGERTRAFLDALVATCPPLRGVRRLLQGEPDPRFCLQPDFVRGVQLLPNYGLSFDICIYHHQLAAAVELVRACPEVSFVLDHIAKPDIRRQVLDPWRAEIAALAALPNVVCKLSGAVTEADHQHWQPEHLAPYVAHVLECFGDERVLFGGDWPVVLLASPYRRWAETLDALTSHLPDASRRKLWADNARRVYRLNP